MTAPAGAPATAPRRPRPRSVVHADVAQPAVQLNRWIAVVALLLTGLRIRLGQELVPGILVAVALLPVWLPALRRFAGARLVVGLGALALLNGVWLGVWSSADHTVSQGLATGASLLLLGILGGIGVVLWARTVLPDAWVGIWLGLGALASELARPAGWGGNPWKFALAVPVSIVVLSAVRLSRRRFVDVVALVVLALFSATQDSRSAFAIYLVAAALLLWQTVPAAAAGEGRSWRRRGRILLVMGAVVAATYNLGVALVLDGHLGESAQQRTLAQVRTSGSLLLGGRPELAATAALMRERPLGFGPGTLPSPGDVTTAKEGMAAIHYDPDNGYVERFMFGTQFRLHSVVGDLWAAFGIPGAALALAVLVLVVLALAGALTARQASGVTVWLTFLVVWDLLFGPLYASAPALVAALGLALLRKEPAPAEPAAAEPPAAPARAYSP
ncbi:hypothetical protein [Cellulomonas sp. NS3]|uniref:hypothetical protein n=1 Tax=Cellulomonas sp. NS3 TaxID=2973977 RepID=UPI0037C18BE0